jgi:hypothetical protein
MRLAWCSDLDGAEQILRTPADAGDGQAAQQLGDLLAGVIRDNGPISLITYISDNLSAIRRGRTASMRERFPRPDPTPAHYL